MSHPTRGALFCLSLALAACGDEGGGGGGPDGTPADSHDLTVEIHRDYPYVDGDTVDEAVFVAFQDGDGAFVAATGANGVYHAHITSDRYGIAVGCQDVGFVSIEVSQKVVSEGSTYRTSCKLVPATAQLDVTVRNLPPALRLRLRARNRIAVFTSDGTQSLDVDPGTVEVFGTLTDSDRTVSKLFRYSAIPVAASGAVAIDVAADGAPPEVHALTLTPSDPAATVRTSIVRPYGAISLQTSGRELGTTPSYLVLPAALRREDDLYYVSVSDQTRSQTRTIRSPSTLAFELPAPLQAMPSTLAVTPTLHPVFAFTPTPPALAVQTYYVEASNFSDFTSATFRYWYAELSPGWIAGAASLRYEFPDLTAMPGFSELALVDRERIDTTVSRYEYSTRTASDGQEITRASVDSTVGTFCGDGVVQSSEACDPGAEGETAMCNADCTVSRCGDGVTNFAAGEDCDPPDGATCDSSCKSLPDGPATSADSSRTRGRAMQGRPPGARRDRRESPELPVHARSGAGVVLRDHDA